MSDDQLMRLRQIRDQFAATLDDVFRRRLRYDPTGLVDFIAAVTSKDTRDMAMDSIHPNILHALVTFACVDSFLRIEESATT